MSALPKLRPVKGQTVRRYDVDDIHESAEAGYVVLDENGAVVAGEENVQLDFNGRPVDPVTGEALQVSSARDVEFDLGEDEDDGDHEIEFEDTADVTDVALALIEEELGGPFPDLSGIPTMPDDQDADEGGEVVTGDFGLEKRKLKLAIKEGNADPFLEYKYDKDDKPIGLKPNSVWNAQHLLEFDPRTAGAFAYNEHSHQIEVIRTVDLKVRNLAKIEVTDTKAKLVDEEVLDGISSWLAAPKRFGGKSFEIKNDRLSTALRNQARLQRFHPIKDIIESEMIEDDGNVDFEPLDTMGIRYLKIPDNLFSRESWRLFMTAAVCRIYEPGTDFKHMMILENGQDCGKSRFIDTLSCGYGGNLKKGDLRDPSKPIEAVGTKWVVEVGELAAFEGHTDSEIKDFLSRKRISIRLAYKEAVEEFEATQVYIGTTNKTEYLADPTGASRWWINRLGAELTDQNMIDNPGLEKEIRHLWALAYVNYKRMRAAQPEGQLSFRLSPAAQEIQKTLANVVRVSDESDGYLGLIDEIFKTPVDQGEVIRVGEKHFLRIEGQYYRRVWNRIAILNFLVEKFGPKDAPQDLLKQLDTTGTGRKAPGKSNPITHAIQHIPYLEKLTVVNYMPGFKQYGKQTSYGIVEELFRESFRVDRKLAEEQNDNEIPF